MTSQIDQPHKPKRLERLSDARRSVDSMLRYALASGTATSIGDLLDRVAAVQGRRLFNALLAVLQLPEATMVCTAADWEHKWRRLVRPGERPLVLLIPFGPVEFVFDISQTEATERSLPVLIASSDHPHAAQAERIGLFRMLSLAADLGLEVVAPGQGISVAEGIRPPPTPRMLTRSASGTDTPRTVLSRWLVALDRSSSAADQLASLAQELGRLFCGHLGASQDDPWPNRENRRYDVSDIEAEAVARLLFRRLAPTSPLPEVLARHTADAGYLPQVGWTYVTQAADKIFEMAEHIEVPSDGDLLQLIAMPWTADLVVHPGGSSSVEVVLIRGSSDSHGLPERVASAWAAGASGANTPWVAVARTENAFDGVLSYFREAPGSDPEHELLAQQIQALLPVDSHWMTVVEAGRFEGALVEVHGDPPAHNGDMVSASVSEIQRRGIECLVPELDESWMYSTIECSTGDVVREQVLGWDDMYNDEQWRFLGEAGRVFVAIRPDAGLHEPRIVELLAEAIASARRQVQAYYSGDFDYLDNLDEPEGALLVE